MIDNNLKNNNFFESLNHLDLNVKIKKNVGIETIFLP